MKLAKTTVADHIKDLFGDTELAKNKLLPKILALTATKKYRDSEVSEALSFLFVSHLMADVMLGSVSVDSACAFLDRTRSHIQSISAEGEK